MEIILNHVLCWILQLENWIILQIVVCTQTNRDVWFRHPVGERKRDWAENTHMTNKLWTSVLLLRVHPQHDTGKIVSHLCAKQMFTSRSDVSSLIMSSKLTAVIYSIYIFHFLTFRVNLITNDVTTNLHRISRRTGDWFNFHFIDWFNLDFRTY